MTTTNEGENTMDQPDQPAAAPVRPRYTRRTSASASAITEAMETCNAKWSASSDQGKARSADNPTGPKQSKDTGGSRSTTPPEPADGSEANLASELVNKILSVGVNGLGPYKSSTQIAAEALHAHGDAEAAIQRLIATHRRWVGSSGFAAGLGGLATLPVSLPADVTVFYMLCARMSAAIAVIRGYDIESEEVQSAVLISLLGAGAAGVLGKVGVEVGTKTTMAALKKLPGQLLIEINKKVGYRLITKFGTKGSINLVRAVPLVGGGVGAGVNVLAINQIAKYAKTTFTPLDGAR